MKVSDVDLASVVPALEEQANGSTGNGGPADDNAMRYP